MVNSYYYFHFLVASHRSSHLVLQHSLVNIDFGFVNNNLVAKVPGLLCTGPLSFPVKIRNTKRHSVPNVIQLMKGGGWVFKLIYITVASIETFG